jgi:hypothetical protein
VVHVYDGAESSKKYDAKDKHWAYIAIGLIIGFC